jgi:mRNA interferase RelE/StbE
LTFRLSILDTALEDLEKLDPPVRHKILNYLATRLEGCSDPRSFGKPLTGNRRHFWRYRMGDYRIICQIKNHELIVCVVHVAHRKHAYH